MSKAVLVIDMPDSCDKCEFGYYSDGRILLCGYKDKIGDKENKPNWCPLQPIPERKGKHSELNMYDTDNHYEIGWNACLDKILGE